MRKFSVITITFNDLKGLKKTVTSLESQRFTDYEHVIVDGGSTDGSAEWIADYASRAAQPVRYVSEADNGIYDGMNKGIAMAEGEIVVFMNSADCFYSPHTLEFVANKFAATGARWLFGQLQFVNEEGTVVEITSQQRYSVSRSARGHGYCPHQATYMQRSLLEELGGFDEGFSYAADQELCLRAGLIAEPVVLPDYLGLFLAGGTHSGATGKQREELYAKMRAKNNLVLLGQPLIDRAFTTLTASYRDGRKGLANRYRAMRHR